MFCTYWHSLCVKLKEKVVFIVADLSVYLLVPQAIEDIAREYIGQTVFTNWPHLSEAKVIAVANDEYQYVLIL